mgnify:CR=1 FL=1
MPVDIPALLSDAKLWLDAENIDGESNNSLFDGDLINEWKDLSGANQNLLQNTNSLKPIFKSSSQNNLAVVEFNNSLMTMSSFRDWPTNMTTVFIVQKLMLEIRPSAFGAKRSDRMHRYFEWMLYVDVSVVGGWW